MTDHEESITRNGPKDWKWIKGEGVIDTNNVESLLKTLSSLHAVRWVGATIPAHGFDKPTLTITSRPQQMIRRFTR